MWSWSTNAKLLQEVRRQRPLSFNTNWIFLDVRALHSDFLWRQQRGFGVQWLSADDLATLPKRPAALRNTYALVSEPFFAATSPPWPDRARIWETAHPYLYMRTTDDGRVLLGGEDDRFRNPIARDRRIERKSKRLIEKVGDLLPHVALEVADSWAGTFGETADALPRIGPVHGRPNLFVAACYGRKGITLSMLAADMLESRVRGEAHILAECMRCDR